MEAGRIFEYALAAASSLCAENDSALIFLSLFGSRLYGTNSDESDFDFRGLFLPSLRSFVLGRAKSTIHYSTGANQHRNSGNDLDLDLYAIDHWALKLLPQGDTDALDLLFSVSRPDCTILYEPCLSAIFANPTSFLDLDNNREYELYCLGQAKKYGMAGTRAGALKSVISWLEGRDPGARLSQFMDDLLAACGDSKYCYAQCREQGRFLAIGGKFYMEGIRLGELRQHIARDIEKNAKGVNDAASGIGIDYKALSHAMRSLLQMEELLLTGRIVYPLAGRKELMAIRSGALKWPKLESAILSRMAHVRKLYGKYASFYKFDRAFAEKCVLACYGLEPE